MFQFCPSHLLSLFIQYRPDRARIITVMLRFDFEVAAPLVDPFSSLNH